MKKLFALKKWLTLQEAARHLAIVFGEEVCEADVLRLALDGQLTLSVNFVNHARALKGQVIPIEEAEYKIFPAGIFQDTEVPEELWDQPIKVMKDFSLDDKRVLRFGNDVVTLDGVYDLPMLGNERHDVEHRYQKLTKGPSVTLGNLSGLFVVGDINTMYQIQESYDENEYQKGSIESLRELAREVVAKKIDPEKQKELLAAHEKDREIFLAEAKKKRKAGRDSENYYPAHGLPRDSVMVVRTDALREFEQSIATEPAQTDKPLNTTERNTLLIVIAALCNYSAIDPKARGAAGQIASMTVDLDAAVTDDTIRKILEKIPNAVETRMK